MRLFDVHGDTEKDELYRLYSLRDTVSRLAITTGNPENKRAEQVLANCCDKLEAVSSLSTSLGHAMTS